jgi:hypothetical protein
MYAEFNNNILTKNFPGKIIKLEWSKLFSVILTMRKIFVLQILIRWQIEADIIWQKIKLLK